MLRFAPFVLTVALLTAGRAQAVDVAIETLDGRRLAGELTDWTAAGVDVRTGDGSTTIPAEQLLAVRPASVDEPSQDPSGDAQILVRFHDGTLLPATEATVAARVVTIQSPWSTEPLQAPTAQVQLIELTPRNEAADRVWAELQRKELPGDVLLVMKKGGASVDYLAGVVGEVTAEQVQFEWEGDRIPVKRSKVAAIAFYRGQAADEELGACRLQLDSGARVTARDVQLLGEVLQVETPSGMRLQLPLGEVAFADYSLGKLAYLGDERPLDSQWTPLLGLPPGAKSISGYGEPRFNVDFKGEPIRLLAAEDDTAAGGQRTIEYAKGVALRSRTEIVFAVPAGMQRFVTLAGIAPACAAEGRVRLTVFADRRPAWEGDVIGGEPPQEIAIDLQGARRLRIFVDYGENLDYGDQLHLAMARFTK